MDAIMPFFKTTANIFVDFGEYFDPNWMDSNEVVLPPKTDWDYTREMTIEDVDLWEVVAENAYGVYAAWSPYAEFYLIKYPYASENDEKLQTFYGPGAGKSVAKKMKELGFYVPQHKVWVEPEDMWLYQ
jgi:hypothetical protein